MKKIQWCRNCLAMSTRPRITFDDRGFCNACCWMEKKQYIDWRKRKTELDKVLKRHRRVDGFFDCLVPVSGGKDGSYVAHQLKHKHGMKPLCLTVNPPLQLKVGQQNLKAFVASGYEHIGISPCPSIMQKLNKVGFVKLGFPYYGWLTAIQATPVRIASNMGINLIFYGEDGEVEYGGTNKTEAEPIYNVEYMKKIYLEGGYDTILRELSADEKGTTFFKFPFMEESKSRRLDITHWSYFENWDPYRNYIVAKSECGLTECSESSPGTFTNYSQTDQSLYSLHTYLMYLKYGFGRANQDACIEIRRGAMDRQQAINLVKLYDGQMPEDQIPEYLSYFKMTRDEFFAVLKKWANKDLFRIENYKFTPLFSIK